LIDCLFFFFQAEDGIRDRNVTGVQTCALPISLSINCAPKPLLLREVILTNSLLMYFMMGKRYTIFHQNISTLIIHMEQAAHFPRSEERRVGKESRSRRAQCHKNKCVEEARKRR